MPQDARAAAAKPAATAPPAAAAAEHDAPIVIDLGSRSRKQVKKLRRGQGKLMDRLAMVVEELKHSGTVAAGAQPIVIVVKEKRKDVFGLFD